MSRFAFVAVAAIPYPLIAQQFFDGRVIPILIAAAQIIVSGVFLRILERQIKRKTLLNLQRRLEANHPALD